MKSNWIQHRTRRRRSDRGGLRASRTRGGSEAKVARRRPATKASTPSVRPQDDFFRHVNGGWIAPPRFRPTARLMARSSSSGTRANPTSARSSRRARPRPTMPRRLGSAARSAILYKSFMDEARADRLGKKPIEADLARVDAIADKAGIDPDDGGIPARRRHRALRCVRNHRLKEVGPVHPLPEPGRPRAFPMRRITATPSSSRSAKKYLSPTREDVRARRDCRTPKAEAAKVMAVETALAKNHWDRVKSRDRTLTYNKMDRKALDSLSPGVDWNAWFSKYGDAKIDDVVVRQPDYFKAISTILARDSARRLEGLAEVADPDTKRLRYLSKPFVDEDFAFFQKTLDRVARDAAAMEARGGARRAVPGRGRRQAVCGQAFSPRRQGADEGAGRQLDRSLSRRYPVARLDERRDAEAGPRKAGQVHSQDRLHREVARLFQARDRQRRPGRQRSPRQQRSRPRATSPSSGKPVDREEWGMTPQTVNAYYNPSMNEIVFPAAILQPPFFDMNADDAFNYGAIGAVIGHEIGHGFDDQGSKFDGDGNMNNWWTDARPQGIREPGQEADRSVQLVRAEAIARAESQRCAHHRREHRRPGRAVDRVQGVSAVAQGPGAAGDRRPDRRSAVLHRLGPGVAEQVARCEHGSNSSPPTRTHRPSSAATVSCGICPNSTPPSASRRETSSGLRRSSACGSGELANRNQIVERDEPGH